jgi:hypothetical protein
MNFEQQKSFKSAISAGVMEKLIEENRKLKEENLKKQTIIDKVVSKYDGMVYLYENIEGEYDTVPQGFKELSDMMDYMVDNDLVKNTLYWSDRDQWEAQRQ